MQIEVHANSRHRYPMFTIVSYGSVVPFPFDRQLQVSASSQGRLTRTPYREDYRIVGWEPVMSIDARCIKRFTRCRCPFDGAAGDGAVPPALKVTDGLERWKGNPVKVVVRILPLSKQLPSS